MVADALDLWLACFACGRHLGRAGGSQILLASSSRHAGVGMDRSAQDPLVLENRHTGERLELRRIAQDGETWLELKGSLPPHRDGPPLHVHHDEDEGGRVLSGTLSAVVDGRKIEVRVGETASFPRGLRTPMVERR